MKIKSLTVFCGSKSGNNPLFIHQATALGKLLALNNIELVYGGGNKGLMGAVANGCLANGGKVTGIMPKLLLEWSTATRQRFSTRSSSGSPARRT